MTLHDYIARYLAVPFAWGEQDCFTFAARWAREASGVDCFAGLSAWATAMQAARTSKRAGGMAAQFDRHLQRIEPNFARDGDIALAHGTALIFVGARIAGPSKAGLAFFPRDNAEIAWRVSCRT